MKIVFIHGKKLKKDGSLHPEFISRLEKVLKLYKDKRVDLIIVSGGKTRSSFPSEADMGADFLEKKNPNIKIVKLKNCLVTIEAILSFNKFCKAYDKIEKIFVVMSSWPMIRTRVLYKKLFDYPVEIEFVKTKTTDYLFYFFTEPLGIIYALIYNPKLGGIVKLLFNWYRENFRNASMI